ncbi:MAG: alpha/beta fold hydrolase [Syntrophomonas sp.]|nr:alpha/beta fold hydrolase [Syntrophomonas sp.]
MAFIAPQAESFLLTGFGDTACLFIHGFTASPSEVYPLACLIHDMIGCTVSGPLLPGHGTNPFDLNRTKWQDWFARVDEEIDYLLKKHSRVFTAGLSMGGLLSLHAACKRSELRGAIAINTPIFTNSPWLTTLAPVMQYIKPYYPKKIDETYDELLKQGRFAYPVMPVKAYISMGKLRKAVMQEIAALNMPVLIFQSSRDEAVDRRSADFIKGNAIRAKVRLIELKESGHIATMSPDNVVIADEITGFINNLSG